MKLRDAVTDVLIEVSRRPGRAIMLAVAIALSAGSLVGSIGLSQTARSQVAQNVAASTLNMISVTVAQSDSVQTEGTTDDSQPSAVFPPDSEARVKRLDLVTATGRLLDAPEMSDNNIVRHLGSAEIRGERIEVYGATAGLLQVQRLALSGADSSLLGGDLPIAWLSAGAAKRLSIPDRTGDQLRLGTGDYTVGGFASTQPGSALRGADFILVPYSRALTSAGSDKQATLYIAVQPGAGPPVSLAARLALRPDRPTLLATSQVVDASKLRRGVDSDMARLAGGVGAFMACVAMLLIANSMSVSVLNRTSEIGLRRALGSSRSNIARLFWLEGAVAGVLGGLAGSAFGIVLIVAISSFYSWTPRIGLLTALSGVVIGIVMGTLSAIHPAVRAARIDPALAVRLA